MSSARYERIRNNPKFRTLVQRRRRFALTLSLVVVLTYYGFMAVVAFQPDILRTPLVASGVTSLGVPVGVGIIFLSWLLTGVYVRRANSEFDALNSELLKETLQ